MAKKFFRKKSKRQTCKKRYKIEKKVREHNKKLRKETKGKKSRSKKDPGIPNSFPFKEEVLREAEIRKQRLEEERQMQKDRQKAARAKLTNEKRSLSELVKDASVRREKFEASAVVAEVKSSVTDNSLKTFYKEFEKVVEAADVILEVLDARDPLGSRSRNVEEAVLKSSSKKRLVLLLNKIDLVPKENVEKWLKYLKNELPVIAFKACTQVQRNHLASNKVPTNAADSKLLQTSQCVGAGTLMKLLGNYCRSNNIQTSITVGVVGLPNTGKSSVINSLKRSKVCNVGAVPGMTKSMQVITLDKHIKLLDSPGVVFVNNENSAKLVLNNCLKFENLEDPEGAITSVIEKCNKAQLMLMYQIPDFTNTEQFLISIARRYGKLKKGGIPDVKQAAHLVLQDWNQGKITYSTEPPQDSTSFVHVEAEIVQELKAAFDIDSLLQNVDDDCEDISNNQEQDIGVEIDEEMKDSDDIMIQSHSKVNQKGDMATSLRNKQLNRQKKQDLKKLKKQKKKVENRADKLCGVLENFMMADDNYNFDTDCK